MTVTLVIVDVSVKCIFGLIINHMFAKSMTASWSALGLCLLDGNGWEIKSLFTTSVIMPESPLCISNQQLQPSLVAHQPAT